MTVNYTTLLGLAKPVSGTESGTWGDTVNTNLTDYLDSAVAGTQIISGSLTAVTLSKTTGSSLSQAGPGSTGSSQYQIIRCTGNPASLLTITAPYADKTYVIINATSTSQSVKIVGVGPTSPGVTIASGKTSLVAWNGSDFVEITPATATTATTATNLASGSAGTIPYQSASGTTAMLAAGTSGQVLTSAGAAAPTWSTPAAATKTISNKTVNYTVVAGDLGKIINCTSGTFTVSLTAAASLGSGFTCTIWNTSNTASNVITIDPAGTETIDGKTTLTLQRGEGLAIVCDGTNWQTDDKKPMRNYAENSDYANRASATGDGAVAIGGNANASGAAAFSFGGGAISSGSYSLSLGLNTTASGVRSVGIGNNAVDAGSDYSTALGTNSGTGGSVTATGAGAMALGGSYASGTDSFAAGIANNTSSYGATGANSVAMGSSSKASNTYSVAIGKGAVASGFCSLALSGRGDVGVVAAGVGAVAIGEGAYSLQNGKYTFCYESFSTIGDAQFGKLVLRGASFTSAAQLNSDGLGASTANQLVVASGQAMAIQGTLIGKISGSNNMVAYNITGAVSNNAGTMVGTGLALAIIGTDSIGLTAAPTITLDTTNKAVAITSGYKSSTNIRWVATLNTSEVTYA